jgi:catechol 2,3-dioxygenase-like lactoylglutathione lyase family enzyme
MVLEYVVLRCADMERSRAFYEALGLHLVDEQHGSGARHYSCRLRNVVLELYPLAARPTSGVRLGIQVPNLEATVEAVRAIGAVVRMNGSGATASAVLRDPDGHEIAVESQAARES